MTVSSAIVAVTDVATALNTALNIGQTLLITNGAAAIDLGPATVATGAGFAVAISGVTTVNLKPGDVLFAVCAAAGSSSVKVLRT